MKFGSTLFSYVLTNCLFVPVFVFLILTILFFPPSSAARDEGNRGAGKGVYTEASGKDGRGIKPETPAEAATSLEISVQEAIMLSISNNRSIKVEKYITPIQITFEEEQEAAFDPELSTSAGYARQNQLVRSRSSTGLQEDTEDLITAGAGISKFYSTGTTVELGVSTERNWSDLYSDQYASRAGLSVTQALLRGAGTEVNLVRLRQARLATSITEQEFSGFAEALIAEVEETYWDYALALQEIEIFEKSLLVAVEQLQEIQELIAVGRLAETETIAAEAEIAEQRQGLIEAKGRADTARLKLLRLMNPPGAGIWERKVALRDAPRLPAEAVLDPVETHVSVALKHRPDLRQARLGLEADNLEIVRTRNGLLPKMDFFIALGKTGYSDSFGGSFGNIADKYFDLSAGISISYPFGNKKAEAEHRRSLLTKDQSVEAVSNLEQLIELEVRSAYIEATRTREQILAGAASRRLQEEKLRIETEKLRVGRSTAFLLSQAQRDLLLSRIREIKFIAEHLKTMVRLYKLEGSLLSRRLVFPF